MGLSTYKPNAKVILADDQVRGLAVHVGARIVDGADPGEVNVSRVTRDLAENGRGLNFEAQGPHRLKGAEGDRESFAISLGDGAS